MGSYYSYLGRRIYMKKNDILTQILTILGTVLVWIPLLAPTFFSLIFFVRTRMLRFDYLMPAELFPLALIGGGLLLWAAWRSKLHKKLIGWSLGIAVGSLFASQGLAVVTGLASGEIEASGMWFVLVVALLAVYVIALIVMAVGGILFLRDLFRPTGTPD